jgi:hypothetical protein
MEHMGLIYAIYWSYYNYIFYLLIRRIPYIFLIRMKIKFKVGLVLKHIFIKKCKKVAYNN